MDMEKWESLYVVGRNVKWYSPYGKQYESPPPKLKIQLPYDPVLPMDVYSKELTSGSHGGIGNAVFTEALFTVVKMWKQSKFPLTDECVLVTQSCLTLCDPMDCSPTGSPVHRILQARTLEWVAIPFSRWIDKENVVCMYGILFSFFFFLKREEILPYMTTWMNLEGIMLSNIYQVKRTGPAWFTYMKYHIQTLILLCI